MKPSGFDIIELFRNNYKPEAHAMNKSITQATQDDKQISKSIKRFFTRFHVSSALKASNVYKKKGIPVTEIFQYLFLLIFSNRSMYMSLITGRNTPGFAKDSVYRFMKMIQINWIRFTTILSSRIIKDAIIPLDSKEDILSKMSFRLILD